MRDLKTILQRVPSLVVFAAEQNLLQSSKCAAPSRCAVTRIDSISEFNGEDNYMCVAKEACSLFFSFFKENVLLYFCSVLLIFSNRSRIGVGGIINIEKMYKTHQVLDNIRTFHIHAIRRNQLLTEMKCSAPNIVCLVGPDATNRYFQQYYEQMIESELSMLEKQKSFSGPTLEKVDTNVQTTVSSRLSTASSSQQKQEKEQFYQIDLNVYKPIQSLSKSHGISLIPLDCRSIDYHNLQAMHHGTTMIHFEEDTTRSSIVFLQLEESNSTLAWCKPFWSTTLRFSGNTPQNYQLSSDIEETILPGLTMKYETKEAAMIGLEEGFIDLMNLKDIVVGQSNVDLAQIARRHCLPDSIFTESSHCSIKLLFGVNLSDNRTTEFIAPKNIATLWVDGLRAVLQLIQTQKKLCDQRILWLKEKYLQLYFEDGLCIGPNIAEAIRIFGGRKRTVDAIGVNYQSFQDTSKMLNNSKLRKKKSSVNLSVIRDYTTRSQTSINSEMSETLENNSRSPQHGGYKTSKMISNKSSNHICSTPTNSESRDGMYNFQINSSAKSNSSCEMSKFDLSPIHTSLLTSNYREKFCKRNQPNSNSFDTNNDTNKVASSTTNSPIKSIGSSLTHTPKHKMAITEQSNLDFIQFFELFRCFLICLRRDIRDTFEQIASKSMSHSSL